MFSFGSAQLFAANSVQLALARCGRGQAPACSCLQPNLFRLAAPLRTTQDQGRRAAFRKEEGPEEKAFGSCAQTLRVD